MRRILGFERVSFVIKYEYEYPFEKICVTCYNPSLTSTAIFGDGDLKSAPFLVLGLVPWYLKIFLFSNKLRHRLRHTRVHAARIFCGCRAGAMASEIHEIYALGPQLNTFMPVGICLSIFVVGCSRSKVRQCRIKVCPALSLTKWCSAASFLLQELHITTL